jgi:hypothetical protein
VNHYAWTDIFQWAVLLLNAGCALHAGFQQKNRPVAMMFAGAALGSTYQTALMAIGLGLVVYGWFLMLRHQSGTSSC